MVNKGVELEAALVTGMANLSLKDSIVELKQVKAKSNSQSLGTAFWCLFKSKLWILTV